MRGKEKQSVKIKQLQCNWCPFLVHFTFPLLQAFSKSGHLPLVVALNNLVLPINVSYKLVILRIRIHLFEKFVSSVPGFPPPLPPGQPPARSWEWQGFSTSVVDVLLEGLNGSRSWEQSAHLFQVMHRFLHIPDSLATYRAQRVFGDEFTEARERKLGQSWGRRERPDGFGAEGHGHTLSAAVAVRDSFEAAP